MSARLRLVKTRKHGLTAMASNLKRVLVLGGNGYVGQNVCTASLQRGVAVRSLNRSGPPKTSPAHLAAPLSQVEWVSGDIFDKAAREEAMSDVDAVISCVGAFGSNSFMSRICGDATIEAVQTAKEKKVERFGFVSSAQVYEGSVGLALPPSAPMHGYFQGKYRAEKELLATIPKHVILRPGFIFGPRQVGTSTIPLQLIGGPLSAVGTQLGPVSSLLQSIPFAGKELASMVPVDRVGEAMIRSLEGVDENGIILDAAAIRQY